MNNIKKNIMIVITTAFCSYGGLTTVIMNYLRNMNLSDLEISIISGNDPDTQILNEIKSLGIKYIKIAGRKTNPIYYFSKLYKLCKNYDVIHINSNSATAVIELLAAKLAGVKNRIVHNHTSIPNHKNISNILKPIFDKMYTCPLSCSISAGDWLFGRGKYTVLNNGIDVEKFRYNEDTNRQIRKELGIDNNSLILGNVANFYEGKNHFFILDLFYEYYKCNSDSYLLLVGDGEYRNLIEEKILNLGIKDNVILTGKTNRVSEYLSVMDAFIFPSVWEGMSSALIEALASGTRCIVSDTLEKECDICGNLEYLPIEKGTNVWSNYLKGLEHIDKNKSSEYNISKLTEKGYNSKKNSNVLRELYLK